MKPAIGPVSMSKLNIFVAGLEYNTEVSLMRTLPIIARFHEEPMNNIKDTANMHFTYF